MMGKFKGRKHFQNGRALAMGTALACLAWPVRTGAQTTCPEPAASDFKKTTLLSSSTMDHPVHMAIAPDGRVFIGEMTTGNIQVYKPGQATPVLAGKVATRFENEDGLLGVAIPPDFATSQFFYVLATDPDKTTRSQVLWRYKVNGDLLDNATKTEILRIPRVKSGIYHDGGGMHFDKKGNLWFSSGDDSNPHDTHNAGFGPIYTPDPGADAQKSASNTNDLRGKISRIHPEAAMTDGKWYSIPAGNLKETMSTFWTADELTKVRPEIFAMGMRNPYRFTVDDQTGWLIWGEVGPDADATVANRGRSGHDEFNVAPTPGYYGWPYCNGNQFAYNFVDYSTNTSTGVIGDKYDCSKLTNTSPNNTGVTKLPPARPPIIWYAVQNTADFPQMGTGQETAMGGPMYRYDKNLKSTTKFPPQYDGRLFIWDWTRQTHKFITLNADGSKVDKWYDFPISGMRSDIAADYGPEGSLYVLQYSQSGYGDNNAALYRIDYTGTINDACAPAVSIAKSAQTEKALSGGLVSGLQPIDLPAEAKGLEAFDLSGRKVWSYARQGATGALRLDLPRSLASGLLRIRYL